jgi:hypothetical protein
MLRFWSTKAAIPGGIRAALKGGCRRSERITVSLHEFAADALKEASAAPHVTHTDVINHALLVYAALQGVATPGNRPLQVFCNGEVLWIDFPGRRDRAVVSADPTARPMFQRAPNGVA